MFNTSDRMLSSGRRTSLPPASRFGAAWLSAVFLALTAMAGAGAADLTDKTLFDFEGEKAPGWEASAGGTAATVPGPKAVAEGADRPAAGALQVKVPKAGWVRSAAGAISEDWTGYSDLTFWVHRTDAVVKDQPRVTGEVRVRAARGGHYWRRFEVTRPGWQQISLPLRWFRPADSRVPGWDRMSRLEFYFREAADLTIDTVRARADRESGPHPTPDDLREVGFPGSPAGAVRSKIESDLWVLTNAPDLDLDGLTKHLRKVADRVVKDLGLPEPKGPPPCLMVFANRQQYQAFPVHLAEKLDAEPALPKTEGYSTSGVGTSYWDAVAGSGRPVYTHEFVHSLIEQCLGVGSRGDWLHEGIATYYQLVFHPQLNIGEVVREEFARKGSPRSLPRVCGGSQVPTGRYWQVGTLVEMLMTEERYKPQFAGLLTALCKSESTDLAPHLSKVLGTSWEDLETDWATFCVRRYRGAPAPGEVAGRPELPADTEVHGVGVYQPQTVRFGLGEVRDWPGLAARLSAGPRGAGPAGRIWDRLPEPARRVLTDPDRAAAIAKLPAGSTGDRVRTILEDRRAVLEGFQTVLEDATLHATKEFAGLTLTDAGKELIRKGDKRSGLETRRLNRLLLRGTFPDEWGADPVDPEAVEVEVKVSRPVVLVLTACESCRWVVRPGRGAKVLWVIVSGYYPQEVDGVTCPVTVVGRLSSSGDSYRDSIYVYDKSSDRYERYQERVAGLTGKPIMTFQGANTYPGKPFIVGPAGR